MAVFVRFNCVKLALKRVVKNDLKLITPFFQQTFPYRLCHHNALKTCEYKSHRHLMSNIRTTQKIYARNIHLSNRINSVVSFKLTDIGEGIKEVSVKEWFVKVGDQVEQFDNICEVQSDKASVTITSRYDGIIKKLYYKIDDIALVGQTLVDIEVEDLESEKNEETEETKENEQQITTMQKEQIEEKFTNKVLATPAVRRLSKQYQVELTDITASGKDGRVLKEDILNHINMSSEETNVLYDSNIKKSKVEFRGSPKTSMTANTQTEEIIPIKGFTRAMIKTMSESLKIPHFSYSDEVDVSKLVALRTELKSDAASRGISLSYMPFLIKSASLALKQYPILNSSLDERLENIIYKTSHNIGVAMDTPLGLVVPNIKGVEEKTIFEIAAELNFLQDKGSKGSLTMEQLSGGTFSLSNIGIIGGTYTKPVIFPPQVAIGAIGKIQVLPRFDAEGNVVKASILCISFSADHRIIDGVTMAKFSNQWKYYIENPYRFLLDL